ncbi:hypothetical protein [Rhodopirellula sallentina]|uniref:Putative membrane protein n=1 Tax=Rhodopirellula sallentina SM41 TaxID=1263870 RepID=M5U756_9BACT|nr:hypothetical protein [Rhodopirellula sallentina]EMI57119.1 putative membrane protein [Rhodopirellula sallentina SM41]
MSTNPDSIWVCFPLKILTRSFLIDMALVSLASFVLVCSVARSRELIQLRDSSIRTYQVCVKPPGGEVQRFLIANSSRSVDQLRNELVRQMIGPVSPQVGLVRWYQETSQAYAESVGADQPIDRAGQDPFRTVSLRQPDGTQAGEAVQSKPGVENSATTVPSALNQTTRWREYWVSRDEKAERWLTSYESQISKRAEVFSQSIEITQPNVWRLSESNVRWAVMIALATIAVGSLWRLLLPPVVLGGGVRLATANPGALTESTAAMCFRESWIRIRQPLGVTLRGAAGWSMVGAATLSSGMMMFLALSV